VLKPPHLLSEEERKKISEKKDMYIDIGATSQQEVENAGVRVGDPIILVSEFAVLPGTKAYMAKALLTGLLETLLSASFFNQNRLLRGGLNPRLNFIKQKF